MANTQPITLSIWTLPPQPLHATAADETFRELVVVVVVVVQSNLDTVGRSGAIGIDASINPVADSGQFEAERYWVHRIVNPHVPLSHISTVLIANRSCSARTWFQCRALHLAVSTMGNNLHQVEKIWIKFAPSLHSRGNVTRNWVEEIADTWK
jgi:hypothetical protein